MAIARYIILPYHNYLNDCTMQDCGVKEVYGAKLIFVMHESWLSVFQNYSHDVLVCICIAQYRRLWVWKLIIASIKTVVFGVQHIPCKLQCKINTQADKRHC